MIRLKSCAIFTVARKFFFNNWYRKMVDCKLPVVVILGATGTGKSKLAVELAKKFNGEIISADSMQVYTGLDIITNKVTLEEMDGVMHHVIDYVNPLETYTVVEFRSKALPIVNSLLEQNKLPIIVGGTNYYIESMLWKVLVADENSDMDTAGGNKRCSSSVPLIESPEAKEMKCNVTPENSNGVSHEFHSVYQQDLSNVPNAVLYKRLQEVDPEMAEQVHPNDRRKIIRSIEVFEDCGRTHSEIINEQKSVDGGSSLGGPLRFPNSCIFWLQCEQSVLDRRLDDRVDDMMKRGLISELLDFHERYNKHKLENDSDLDFTKGIFQCIGFKEFRSYLSLDDHERKSSDSQKLLDQGIDLLKLVTKRYARKQIKWINNRFLRCPDRSVPPVYTLNATEPENWNSSVFTSAVSILSALLNNETPTAFPAPIEQTPVTNRRKQMFCEICDKICLGDVQWTAHMKSRVHKKMMLHVRKLEAKQKNTAVST